VPIQGSLAQNAPASVDDDQSRVAPGRRVTAGRGAGSLLNRHRGRGNRSRSRSRLILGLPVFQIVDLVVQSDDFRLSADKYRVRSMHRRKSQRKCQ
jgi:hypothetical protein